MTTKTVYIISILLFLMAFSTNAQEKATQQGDDLIIKQCKKIYGGHDPYFPEACEGEHLKIYKESGEEIAQECINTYKKLDVLTWKVRCDHVGLKQYMDFGKETLVKCFKTFKKTNPLLWSHLCNGSALKYIKKYGSIFTRCIIDNSNVKLFGRQKCFRDDYLKELQAKDITNSKQETVANQERDESKTITIIREGNLPEKDNPVDNGKQQSIPK